MKKLKVGKNNLFYAPLQIVPADQQHAYELLWTRRIASDACPALNAHGMEGNPAHQRRLWLRGYYKTLQPGGSHHLAPPAPE